MSKDHNNDHSDNDDGDDQVISSQEDSSNIDATTQRPPQPVLGRKMMATAGIIESMIAIGECVATLTIIQGLITTFFKFLSANNIILLSYILETIYIVYRYRYLFKYVDKVLPNWFGMVLNNYNNNNNNSIKERNILSKRSIQFMGLQSIIFIISLSASYITKANLFTLENVLVIGDYGYGGIKYHQLILSLLVAPIFEELLFRGIVFYCVVRRLDSSDQQQQQQQQQNKISKFSIISTNVLFGLFHLVNLINSDTSLLYIQLQIWLGIICGMNFTLFFVDSRTLYTPIIVHIWNNILSIFLPLSIKHLSHPILLLHFISEVMVSIWFIYTGIRELTSKSKPLPSKKNKIK